MDLESYLLNRLLRSLGLKSLVLLAFLLQPVSLSATTAYRAQVYKSDVRKSPEKGDFFWLSPVAGLNSQMSLEGDDFIAKISPFTAKHFMLPAGGLFKAKISKITYPKTFGRDAAIELELDKLITEDGREFDIEGILMTRASTKDFKNSNAAYSVSKKVLKASPEILASSAVGAIDAIEYGSIPLAIATQGLSVAIGAGAGLGRGLWDSLTTKGKQVAQYAHEVYGFKLKSELTITETNPLRYQDLVATSSEDFGLKCELKNSQKAYSTMFGDLLVLDLDLDNASGLDLYAGDFVLYDIEKDIEFKPNPFMSQQVFTKIADKSKSHLQLSFSVGNASSNYRLKLLDANSQKPLVDLGVTQI